MSKSFKEVVAGKDPVSVVVTVAFVVVGLIGTVLGVLLLHALIEGYVTMLLWRWLIAPTFALAPLTQPQAMGLTLFVSLLTLAADKRKKEKMEGGDILMHIALKPVCYLAVGFLISLLI